MPANKEPVLRFLAPNYRRELEQLHERRLSINRVIKSLEDYDRLRAKVVEQQGQKTAEAGLLRQ